jgi:hypothetical protein
MRRSGVTNGSWAWLVAAALATGGCGSKKEPAPLLEREDIPFWDCSFDREVPPEGEAVLIVNVQQLHDLAGKTVSVQVSQKSDGTPYFAGSTELIDGPLCFGLRHSDPSEIYSFVMVVDTDGDRKCVDGVDVVLVGDSSPPDELRHENVRITYEGSSNGLCSAFEGRLY